MARLAPWLAALAIVALVASVVWLGLRSDVAPVARLPAPVAAPAAPSAALPSELPPAPSAGETALPPLPEGGSYYPPREGRRPFPAENVRGLASNIGSVTEKELTAQELERLSELLLEAAEITRSDELPESRNEKIRLIQLEFQRISGQPVQEVTRKLHKGRGTGPRYDEPAATE